MPKIKDFNSEELAVYRSLNNKKAYKKQQEQWTEEQKEKRKNKKRESYHKNKHKHLPKINNASKEKLKEKLEIFVGHERPEKCNVCGRYSFRGNKQIALALDHCHTSLEVRGWLCARCNLILGKIEDDPEILRALANYLEDPPLRHLNLKAKNKQNVI